jgi:hypothetical protein
MTGIVPPCAGGCTVIAGSTLGGFTVPWFSANRSLRVLPVASAVAGGAIFSGGAADGADGEVRGGGGL